MNLLLGLPDALFKGFGLWALGVKGQGGPDCLKMLFFPPSTRRSQQQNIVFPIDTLPTMAGRQRKQVFPDSLVRFTP
ncbi:MAG: hypothetical protein FJY65_01790 [Calditrichaeota bacterium]|nr:hypothetical protein [Calditrichota bacterium]